MILDAMNLPQQLLSLLIDLTPIAGSVLLLLVVGALAAWIARRVVAYLVRRTGIETLAETIGLVRVLYALQIQSSLTELLARLSVMAIWLTVAMSIADVIGLPGIAEGIAAVVEFLPKVLTATVILAIGLAGADVSRRVVEGVSKRRTELEVPSQLATAIYYLVLILFANTAVRQLGIHTDTLDQLLLLLIGLAGATLGLSMALGGRTVVDNTIARHYIQQIAHPGDSVTIGGIHGVVLRYDALTVTVRDAQGVDHVLPCAAMLADAGFQVDRVPAGAPRPPEDEG